MIGAVMNEGVRGMQIAQREIDQAAADIARAPVANTTAPTTENPEGKAPEQRQDIVQPLTEMARQEQVFNASAKVVSTTDQNLGTLLDITV